jgi:hypothetical protein
VNARWDDDNRSIRHHVYAGAKDLPTAVFPDFEFRKLKDTMSATAAGVSHLDAHATFERDGIDADL